MPVVNIPIRIENAERTKAELSQLARALGEVASSADGAKIQISSFSTGIKNSNSVIKESTANVKQLAAQVVALVGAYKALDTAKGFFQRGIDFASSLEDAQTSIGSIIAATNKISTAQGRTLEGAEKFAASLEISKDVMDQIQVLALESTATFDSLVQGVSGIIAPATKAGIAIEKLPRFAVTAAQAMSTMKIPIEQMRTEIESLLSGNINKAQDLLATNLGITGEMVKNWKAQGVLVEELEKRLLAFKLAGDRVANSWSGLKSNMQDALDYMSKVSGSGIFESIKQSYRELLDLIISTDSGKPGISAEFENVVSLLRDIQDAIGNGILDLTRDLIDELKELNKPENIAEIKRSFSEFKDVTVELFGTVKEVAGAVTSFVATSMQGWSNMPDIIQEMGIVGAVALGKKGKLALLAVGQMDNFVRGLMATASGEMSFSEFAALPGGEEGRRILDALEGKGGGTKAPPMDVSPGGGGVAPTKPEPTGPYTTTPAIPPDNTRKPTGTIENARQKIAELRREIEQMQGSSTKTVSDLAKKFEDIAKAGKSAGLSAEQVSKLQQEYKDAFQAKTLKDFNKELLQVQGNTTALKNIQIAETLRGWTQQFQAAGMTAEQYAPKIEELQNALKEQQEFKDLKVAADFYKELADLSGSYGKSLALQNRLIKEQAKNWERAGIPLEDIAERVRLMVLNLSQDPFDGAYRGLLKFSAEYADSGKQWEKISYSFAGNFQSATREMFDNFLDTGRVSFASLERSFAALLKDMAYQALIQPVVLSVVNGAAGALYGSTTAGGAGGAAAAGTGMGYAGSVIQLGAQAAQGYAVNQLMSGSGGMFGGIANSINSGVAGMFPALFAPSATAGAVNSAVNAGVGAITGTSGTLPTATFTGMLGGAGLAGGLGSLGYGLLGGAIGLPQSQYSGITSGIGSALGYMGGSTLGASLGGTIGSVVPVVGTIVGALAGGLLGSIFGGFGGAEDGPPTYDWHLYQKLWKKGPEEDAPWVFDGYRGSSKGAEGDAYRVDSWGKWGIPDQLRQQGAEYAYSVMKGVSEQSWALADALGAVSGSMKDEYLQGLERQGELYHYNRWRGEAISEEALQKSAEAYTQKATEHMANALGTVNLRPLTIAADGMAADTVDELGQSLTQAFSFYDIGETFKDEKVKAKFQAQARKQIVDAFADLDFSFLRVDFDQSSFAGLQRAYAAVQAWDTVAAGLEAILNPLSELSTQLNTATTQFNGWVANLRDLGWQEEAIAEIEQRRAQYLHEYATAVTRAGEQDLALRALALELGLDSDAYGIRSLQYRQENELAQLAKQYGRDSGLYSTAVEIQQAELAQTRVTQLEKELEKALAAERQAAQAATQNQTTALNNQASALRDSAREAERMRDAFADIVDALEEARRDIWASSDDNLLGSSYRESMAAFEDAYARGMAGDQDALRELPGLADSLLASGRESLATYEQYNDLFYDVDQKLKAAQARAQSGYDAQAAIADSLNAQLDAITAQTDALQKAINAGTAAGEYTGRSVDAIRAELELMRAVLAKEKADVAGDTSAGGASLSQREALLWAKSDRLNAQAYMGRTDWTPASTLAEIYRNNLTLESWYDDYGRYEGLGVEYDTAAARQSIMANKAALLNSQAYQGRTDWIEQDVAAAIANAGMTKDDWYLRYGLGEGVQSGYKAYTGNALYDYDQLLRDKAADLSAEGYLGIAHWTALDVAAEIANQGMTVPQWYELYGKQEGYALKAAATTNKTVEKGLSSVSGAMNKQLASSQALGSIMSGVGSSVSGYMQAVQSGMSGLSSSISRLNLNVTVNVTGGSSSTSSSGTSGASGASGAAPVVDPFARLSSATGVFGSHYQSEYALLTAKARRMMDDGEFDNLPDGYTSWTAAAVAQAIKDAGLSGTKEWYEKHGKVEGFATGGITPADEVFWVGENGPELMMSPRRWGVLSNADSMSLLDSRGAPPVYAVMGKDNREIVAELREIKGYLRQVVTKTDKTAYCADRINGLLRMWDAEGLPATSAA